MSDIKRQLRLLWPALLPVAVIFLKFLIFDVVWCSYTTFKAFSSWQLYLTALCASFILALPSVLSRHRAIQTVIMFALDAWLVATLMYYRTYFTAIPVTAYTLVSNLADFGPSVIDSLRFTDILFPLSSIGYIFMARRLRIQRIPALPWGIATAGLCLIFGVTQACSGGFKHNYTALIDNAHLYASGPVMFTPFGHLAYEVINAGNDFTPAQEHMVRKYLASQPVVPTCDNPRQNIVFILCESLESWVIGQAVEGHEITPVLNSLIADSTTFYAPRLLTQVKGGRSIDGQLLMLTGLIPIKSGTYSVLYPDHEYPSLQKAVKEKYGSRSYLLTVDKPKVWNQGRIARAFGVDTLVAYEDYALTETVGARKRLSDGAFFDQSVDKMRSGEVWPVGEPAFVQLVTYSGHAPWHLPEHLRRITFSDTIPETMADYMITANYTDHALGQLVSYLQSRPDYANTLVVITGDHEGLARHRAELMREPAARGVVDPGRFTPLIVLNSPVAGRYDKIAGQVDVYTTLLQMLGLQNYSWKGLGRSLLDPAHPGAAVGSNLETVPAGAPGAERLRRAHDVSDLIIRYDLLKK